MVQRTELETSVRKMVALDILSKPLSSLGQKAGRRRDKLAGEIAEVLPCGDLERVFAYTKITEEEKARTLRDGIAVFNKEYPKYGKILEGCIEEKRVQKNEHLVYGVRQGWSLGVNEYRGVMRDLGLSAIEADSMYPHLVELSDRLGYVHECAPRTILL